jgi:hypothetical protein
MWSYYQTFEPRRLSLVVGTWNTGPTTPRKMTGRRGCSEGFRTSGKIGQLRWVPPKRLDLLAWHGMARQPRHSRINGLRGCCGGAGSVTAG